MKNSFKFKFVVAVVSLGFSFGAVAAQSVKVHVRHEAQIALGNVELGAIADITSTDVENERALAALILGESPQAGKAVEWSAAEISKRLRPYGRILQDVQLKLPDHITIRRVPTAPIGSLSRDVLKVQIEDSLKATLPDSSWEAHVVELNVPSGLEIPHDGSVQVVPPMTRPRGATNFEVLVVAGGQIVKRIWVPVRVSYSTRVPMLTRQVEPHTRVTASDVTWERRDVTFMMEVPATTADITRAVARTTLIPGAVLNRSQLEREMALRFGEEVELSAGDDGFSVTSKGIAQQNGFVGDTVRVKNVATNKIIDGVVTGNGTVHVRY